MLSANLVVESNLPLADYFGTADGRDEDKMDITVEWEEGTVLPVLCSSPLSFELEVDKEIPTGEQNQTVLLCRARNTLKEEALLASSLSPEDVYKKVAAVCTSVNCDYWSWDGRHLGKWHERAKKIKADVEIRAAAQGN